MSDVDFEFENIWKPFEESDSMFIISIANVVTYIKSCTKTKQSSTYLNTYLGSKDSSITKHCYFHSYKNRSSGIADIIVDSRGKIHLVVGDARRRTLPRRIITLTRTSHL